MCLQYKAFANPVGKGEIAHNKQFLLFLQCFLPIWRAFCHFYQTRNCRLQTVSVRKSLKFVFSERVNRTIRLLQDLTLYCTIPSLTDPEKELKLLKTFWEKEKMLVTSIFSFSQNVFYPLKILNLNFRVTLYFIICNSFKPYKSEILFIW